MVTARSVEQQLKRIGFKRYGWGRGEVSELENILLPGEEIYECTNGIYEGGFALLVSTDVRVLLIDKKPFNYLTVEDLRFDMISEMDYSHRLLGADINISSGDKNLHFRSYNQRRLRKLISHVQHCMAEAKKKQSSHQEGQNMHLEQIDQQLQAYLEAQQQQQVQLQRIQLAQQLGTAPPPTLPEPVKPGPELADYLFAQSLLAQHQAETGRQDLPLRAAPLTAAVQAQTAVALPTDSQLNEIYAAGWREVFGKHDNQAALRIAYSKLPMMLRNRKFGRPSFHAHSQSTKFEPGVPPSAG